MVKKSNLWKNSLKKRGVMPIISKLYKLGLINQNKLKKSDIVKYYKKKVLKSVQNCKFNRIGFKETCDRCTNIDVFKLPKDLKNKKIQLTEYGEDILSKLKN